LGGVKEVKPKTARRKNEERVNKNSLEGGGEKKTRGKRHLKDEKKRLEMQGGETE